jgi:hypothetical protein
VMSMLNEKWIIFAFQLDSRNVKGFASSLCVFLHDDSSGLLHYLLYYTVSNVEVVKWRMRYGRYSGSMWMARDEVVLRCSLRI